MWTCSLVQISSNLIAPSGVDWCACNYNWIKKKISLLFEQYFMIDGYNGNTLFWSQIGSFLYDVVNVN